LSCILQIFTYSIFLISELATAALAAIARLAVIHRAILAAFLARWLICRERTRADHRCEKREENFRVTFHTALTFADGHANASEKMARPISKICRSLNFPFLISFRPLLGFCLPNSSFRP
jgi:hypothetical protein